MLEIDSGSFFWSLNTIVSSLLQYVAYEPKYEVNFVNANFVMRFIWEESVNFLINNYN